jgi:hypothetical protein
MSSLRNNVAILSISLDVIAHQVPHALETEIQGYIAVVQGEFSCQRIEM